MGITGSVERVAVDARPVVRDLWTRAEVGGGSESSTVRVLLSVVRVLVMLLLVLLLLQTVQIESGLGSGLRPLALHRRPSIRRG